MSRTFDEKADPSRPLGTREARVVGGVPGRGLLVACSEQGRAVRLEECAECERCRGWVLEPDRGQSYVLCEVQSAPSASRVDDVDALSALVARPVRDFMTLGAVCVRPDVACEDLAELLVERGLSGLPVVDDDLRPLGIVSKTDLIRARAEGLEPSVVADLMMPLVFSLGESTPLGSAAALMVFEGVHRAPVLDEKGRVVGILSAFDIMRYLARAAGHPV